MTTAKGQFRNRETIARRRKPLLPFLVFLAAAALIRIGGSAAGLDATESFSVRGVLNQELHDPFEPSLSRSFSFEFVLTDARWEVLLKPIAWSGRGSRIVEGKAFGEAPPEFIQARFDGENLYYLYAISTNTPGFASLLNAANALWTRRPAPIGTDDLVMALWYTYGAQSYLATNRSGFAYPLTAGAGDSLLETGEPVLVPVGIEPSNLPGYSYRAIIAHSYFQDSSGVRAVANGSTTNSILEVSEFGQWGELNTPKDTRVLHYFKLGDRAPFLRSEISITATNAVNEGEVPEEAPTLPGTSWIRVYGHFGGELGSLNFTLLTNDWPALIEVSVAQAAYRAAQQATVRTNRVRWILYGALALLPIVLVGRWALNRTGGT